MFRKVIASVLTFTFLVQSLGFSQIQPLELSVAKPVQIEIPKEFGQIVSAPFAPNKSNFIIHIQDAHGSYEAQQNIEKIISYLAKHYGIKTLFLEGGAGKLAPEQFHFFEDRKLDLKVADLLMKRGAFTGAEMFLLKSQEQEFPLLRSGRGSDAKRRGEGVSGYGIEDISFYRDNFRLFESTVNAQPQADAELKKLKAETQNQLNRIFPKDARDFVKAWELHQSENSDWMRYLSVLDNAAQKHLKLDLRNPENQIDFPMLVRYFNLKARNVENVDGERRAFFEFLKGKINSDFYDRLSRFEEEKTNPRFLFEELQDEISKKQIKLPDFPNFFRYAGNQMLQSEMQSKPLFQEMNQLSARIFTALLKTPEEKEILSKIRERILLEKLSHLELTREEWKKVPSGEGLTAKQGGVLNPAINFYRAAEKRESAFLKNIEATAKKNKVRSAILVTGGFHAEGLDSGLKQLGYSVITIHPNFKDTENSRKNYLGAMLPETSQLARALEVNTSETFKALAPRWSAVYRHERDAAVQEIAAGASLGQSSVEDIEKKMTVLFEQAGLDHRADFMMTGVGIHLATQPDITDLMDAMNLKHNLNAAILDLGHGQGELAIRMAAHINLLFPGNQIKIHGIEFDDSLHQESLKLLKAAEDSEFIPQGQVQFFQGDFNAPSFHSLFNDTDVIQYASLGTRDTKRLGRTLSENLTKRGARIVEHGSRKDLESAFLSLGIPHSKMTNWENMRVYQLESAAASLGSRTPLLFAGLIALAACAVPSERSNITPRQRTEPVQPETAPVVSARPAIERPAQREFRLADRPGRREQIHGWMKSNQIEVDIFRQPRMAISFRTNRARTIWIQFKNSLRQDLVQSPGGGDLRVELPNTQGQFQIIEVNLRDHLVPGIIDTEAVIEIILGDENARPVEINPIMYEAADGKSLGDADPQADPLVEKFRGELENRIIRIIISRYEVRWTLWSAGAAGVGLSWLMALATLGPRVQIIAGGFISAGVLIYLFSVYLENLAAKIKSKKIRYHRELNEPRPWIHYLANRLSWFENEIAESETAPVSFVQEWHVKILDIMDQYARTAEEKSYAEIYQKSVMDIYQAVILGNELESDIGPEILRGDLQNYIGLIREVIPGLKNTPPAGKAASLGRTTPTLRQLEIRFDEICDFLVNAKKYKRAEAPRKEKILEGISAVDDALRNARLFEAAQKLRKIVTMPELREVMPETFLLNAQRFAKELERLTIPKDVVDWLRRAPKKKERYSSERVRVFDEILQKNYKNLLGDRLIDQMWRSLASAMFGGRHDEIFPPDEEQYEFDAHDIFSAELGWIPGANRYIAQTLLDAVQKGNLRKVISAAFHLEEQDDEIKRAAFAGGYGPMTWAAVLHHYAMIAVHEKNFQRPSPPSTKASSLGDKKIIIPGAVRVPVEIIKNYADQNQFDHDIDAEFFRRKADGSLWAPVIRDPSILHPETIHKRSMHSEIDLTHPSQPFETRVIKGSGLQEAVNGVPYDYDPRSVLSTTHFRGGEIELYSNHAAGIALKIHAAYRQSMLENDPAVVLSRQKFGIKAAPALDPLYLLRPLKIPVYKQGSVKWVSPAVALGKVGVPADKIKKQAIFVYRVPLNDRLNETSRFDESFKSVTAFYGNSGDSAEILKTFSARLALANYLMHDRLHGTYTEKLENPEEEYPPFVSSLSFHNVTSAGYIVDLDTAEIAWESGQALETLQSQDEKLARDAIKFFAGKMNIPKEIGYQVYDEVRYAARKSDAEASSLGAAEDLVGGKYNFQYQQAIEQIVNQGRDRSRKTTAVYIGAGADISTALFTTNADTFIFIDKQPFNRQDYVLSEEGTRDSIKEYLKWKGERGYGFGQTIRNVPVITLLKAELGVLGVINPNVDPDPKNKNVFHVRFNWKNKARHLLYVSETEGDSIPKYEQYLREGIDFLIFKSGEYTMKKLSFAPEEGLVRAQKIVDTIFEKWMNPEGVLISDSGNAIPSPALVGKITERIGEETLSKIYGGFGYGWEDSENFHGAYLYKKTAAASSLGAVEDLVGGKLNFDYLSRIREVVHQGRGTDEKTTALYLASGADISTALLATDADNLIFVDQSHFNVDSESLNDPTKENILGDYLSNKKKTGFGLGAILRVMKLRAFLEKELDILGARDRKIHRDQADARVYHVTFNWKDRPRRLIFVGSTDIARVNEYEKYIREFSGVDFLIQKSGEYTDSEHRRAAGSSVKAVRKATAELTDVIAENWLKRGGYLILDSQHVQPSEDVYNRMLESVDDERMNRLEQIGAKFGYTANEGLEGAYLFRKKSAAASLGKGEGDEEDYFRQLSGELDKLIRKGIQFKFQSGEEFARALRFYLDHRGPYVQEPPEIQALHRKAVKESVLEMARRNDAEVLGRLFGCLGRFHYNHHDLNAPYAIISSLITKLSAFELKYSGEDDFRRLIAYRMKQSAYPNPEILDGLSLKEMIIKAVVRTRQTDFIERFSKDVFLGDLFPLLESLAPEDRLIYAKAILNQINRGKIKERFEANDLSGIFRFYSGLADSFPKRIGLLNPSSALELYQAELDAKYSGYFHEIRQLREDLNNRKGKIDVFGITDDELSEELQEEYESGEHPCMAEDPKRGVFFESRGEVTRSLNELRDFFKLNPSPELLKGIVSYFEKEKSPDGISLISDKERNALSAIINLLPKDSRKTRDYRRQLHAFVLDLVTRRFLDPKDPVMQFMSDAVSRLEMPREDLEKRREVAVAFMDFVLSFIQFPEAMKPGAIPSLALLLQDQVTGKTKKFFNASDYEALRSRLGEIIIEQFFKSAVLLNSKDKKLLEKHVREHREAWERGDLFQKLVTYHSFVDPEGKQAVEKYLKQLSASAVEEDRFVNIPRFRWPGNPGTARWFNKNLREKFQKGARVPFEVEAGPGDLKDRFQYIWFDILAHARLSEIVGTKFQEELKTRWLAQGGNEEEAGELWNTFTSIQRSLASGKPIAENQVTEWKATLGKIGAARRLPEWQEVLVNLDQILRVQKPVKAERLKGYFEITDDPVSFMESGEKPYYTCQRIVERTGQNVKGEPVNRANQGQFLLAQMVLENGEVASRSILEIAPGLLEMGEVATKREQKVLLVERIYQDGRISTKEFQSRIMDWAAADDQIQYVVFANVQASAQNTDRVAISFLPSEDVVYRDTFRDETILRGISVERYRQSANKELPIADRKLVFQSSTSSLGKYVLDHPDEKLAQDALSVLLNMRFVVPDGMLARVQKHFENLNEAVKRQFPDDSHSLQGIYLDISGHLEIMKKAETVRFDHLASVWESLEEYLTQYQSFSSDLDEGDALNVLEFAVEVDLKRIEKIFPKFLELNLPDSEDGIAVMGLVDPEGNLYPAAPERWTFGSLISPEKTQRIKNHEDFVSYLDRGWQIIFFPTALDIEDLSPAALMSVHLEASSLGRNISESAQLEVARVYTNRIVFMPGVSKESLRSALKSLGLFNKKSVNVWDARSAKFNQDLGAISKYLGISSMELVKGVPIILEDSVYRNQPTAQEVAEKLLGAIQDRDLLAVDWENQKPAFISKLRQAANRRFEVKDVQRKTFTDAVLKQWIRRFDVAPIWIGTVGEENAVQISFASGDKIKLNLEILHQNGIDPTQVVALLRQIASQPDKRQELFSRAGFTKSADGWEVGHNFVSLLLNKIYADQIANRTVQAAA